jgi:hypothetical protein
MAIQIINTNVITDQESIANANTLIFLANSHVKIPVGTTAQRPEIPKNGMIRYNTSNTIYEGYENNTWVTLSGLDAIKQPKNVYPSGSEFEEVSNTNPTLEGSPYRHLYGKPKANGQWQISNTSNFSTTVVNQIVSGNSVSYTTSVSLQPVTHYWRVRYQDIDGVWSEWSNPTSFNPNNIPPTYLTQPYRGGYYIGTIDIGNNNCYYLIVAPNSLGGSTSCFWKVTGTLTTGASSFCDGYLNTYGALNNTTHPAGNWTATRTINGYSDWYLPSLNELRTIIRNNKSFSVDGSELFTRGFLYWSSTQDNAINAWTHVVDPDFGNPYSRCKTVNISTRAIRREPF